MKNLILTCGVLVYSMSSFAGLSTDDFNAMIQENQKQESSLRKKLQNDAGIDTKKVQYGKIDRSKFAAPKGTEQIAVSGGGQVWQNKKDKTASQLQKAEMKRVADELKQAETAN